MTDNQLDLSHQLLYEGYRKFAEIDTLDGYHRFRIEVNMQPGFEREIKIELGKEGESQLNCYVRYGDEVDVHKGKYDFHMIASRSIVIPTSDPKFHRQGTYYLYIKPKPTIFEELNQYFGQNRFKYSLMYSLKGSFMFLNTRHATRLSLGPEQTQIIRYIVEDQSQDYSLHMTTFGGQVQVKISSSVDEASAITSDNRDQATLQTGKTQQFDVTPTSCGDETYMLYIATRCDGSQSCDFQLKMQTKISEPENILIGTPLHDSVEASMLNYYFITVGQ